MQPQIPHEFSNKIIDMKIKKLQNAFPHIDKAILLDIVFEWHKYLYVKGRDIKYVNSEISKMESILVGMKYGLSSLNRLHGRITNRVYTEEIKQCDLSFEIKRYKDLISEVSVELKFLQYEKNKMTPTKNNYFLGLVRIFSVAESEGLEYSGEPGRKLKDPILLFARIITDFKRNTVLKHFKAYSSLNISKKIDQS